jgi:hypothetical protein
MTDAISRDPSADARERRLGKWAGWAAMGMVVLTFCAILVAASGSTVDRTPKSSPTRIEQLVDLHKGQNQQQLSVFIRALAFALLIGVSLYLYDVVRRREPLLPRWIWWAGIITPVLVAATTAIGFYVLRDIADTFVSSGPRTLGRANHLIESSGPLRGVRIGEITSNAALGAWTAAIAFYAMRVGLLTRFLGVWGVGAGVITAILGPSGEPFLLGWVASIGLLALGYWPGEGRPPAWDEGRAVPWPTLGQPAPRSKPANDLDEE